MAEHIVYENGLKRTFPDDNTFNAYNNGEAYFDESNTLRRRDNGQICKSVKVEADDRSDCNDANSDYSSNEEDVSSSQNGDTLPFPYNIIIKFIHYYLTNDEVRNAVNELVKYVAPKAKDFFCYKIMPYFKKIKGQATKKFNELFIFMRKHDFKLKKQTQANAKNNLNKKPHNPRKSDKKVYMTQNEVAQEQLKIFFCLYAIYESSEKLKKAEILDEKALLDELNNPEVLKQSKQYMQNRKALPLPTENEINLICLSERKAAIKVDITEGKNK